MKLCSVWRKQLLFKSEARKMGKKYSYLRIINIYIFIYMKLCFSSGWNKHSLFSVDRFTCEQTLACDRLKNINYSMLKHHTETSSSFCLSNAWTSSLNGFSGLARTWVTLRRRFMGLKRVKSVTQSVKQWDPSCLQFHYLYNHFSHEM